MSAVCPAGHTSQAEDYCDVCGMPIDAAGPGPGTPVSPAPPADVPADVQAGTAGSTQPCPNCRFPNAAEALFCENCGYDFTTGTMPRPLTPPDGIAPAEAAAPPAGQPDQAVQAVQVDQAVPGDQPGQPEWRWVAELWIDPAWYEAQESPDPLPSPGPPVVVPLRARSLLVGRVSQSRNIHPDVDCASDSGVSRRQSQLTSDGSRWFVEDLESANGTFVGPASGPLPLDPVPAGTKRELAPDDRIYVGAWTRIVVREATDQERSSL